MDLLKIFGLISLKKYNTLKTRYTSLGLKHRQTLIKTCDEIRSFNWKLDDLIKTIGNLESRISEYNEKILTQDSDIEILRKEKTKIEGEYNSLLEIATTYDDVIEGLQNKYEQLVAKNSAVNYLKRQLEPQPTKIKSEQKIKISSAGHHNSDKVKKFAKKIASLDFVVEIHDLDEIKKIVQDQISIIKVNTLYLRIHNRDFNYCFQIITTAKDLYQSLGSAAILKEYLGENCKIYFNQNGSKSELTQAFEKII